MATRTETERVAAMMNALRPDWRIVSLRTFLDVNHADRAYADLAIAAAVIATDPTTTTPELLNHHGRWWVAAQSAASTPAPFAASISPGAPLRCGMPGHEHELAHACRICAGDAKAGPSTTEVDDAVLAATPAQAAINTRGLALVRAALTRTGDSHD